MSSSDWAELRRRVQQQRTLLEPIHFRMALPPGTEQPPLRQDQQERVVLAWVCPPPREIKVGSRLSCRVEVRNELQRTIATAHPNPVQLAWRWRRHGEGKRVPLPRLIPGGSTVMVPVRVDAPAVPGDHELQIVLVQEGVCWFEHLLGGHVEAPCRTTES